MKDKQYKDACNSRLKKFAETRIRTSMIGSLDTIETHLQDLWNENTPEAIKLRNKFDLIRQEILDNGNKQIRLLDREFFKYSIELLRNHITLINGRK